MREIRQGQFYRHFKGHLYQIVAVAEHSETGERMVVYQALYGNYQVYVRPYETFVSEVDHGKFPEVAQKYQFELVDSQKEKSPEPAETVLERKPAACGEETDEEKPEEQPQEACESGEEEGRINPILLEFLDAETLQKKMHIMAYYRNQMDENLLNSIAISLDVVVEKKKLQDKYDEIMNCLSTMERFEVVNRRR